MTIAVIGATGTAGSRVVAQLQHRDISVVEISRRHSVDLISGTGLREALAGVDVAIDASNAFPTDEHQELQQALTTATRNVVEACATQQVGHLVFLSISGIDDPVFDEFAYYVAKRAQEQIVTASPVPSTIVKTTQWHEFATNPAAVTFHDDHVTVKDWLIQPIAADTVAEVLVDTALGQPRSTRVITGPEHIRLPELTTQLLGKRQDPRPVHTRAPELTALRDGALLAPEDATVLGPDVHTWLHTLAD